MVMTVGSRVQIGGAGRIAKLTTNQGMIIYESTSDIFAQIVTGGDPPTVSSSLNVDDMDLQAELDIDQVSDGKTIAVYADAVDDVRVVHLTDSGGAPSASTSLKIGSGTGVNITDVRIASLTSAKAAAVWRTDEAGNPMKIAEIDTGGTDPTLITSETDTGISGIAFSAIRLDDNRILVSYKDLADSNNIKCVVIQVNSGFSVGTPSAPTGSGGGASTTGSLAHLSSDKSYLSYWSTNSGDDHIIVNTSGLTAPTYGTPLDITNGRVIGIDTDTILELHGDDAETYDVDASDNISANGDTVDFAPGTVSASARGIISQSTEALITYNDTGDGLDYAVRLSGVPVADNPELSIAQFYYSQGLPLVQKSNTPFTAVDIGNMAIKEDETTVYLATNTASDTQKVAKAVTDDDYATWANLTDDLGLDDVESLEKI